MSYNNRQESVSLEAAADFSTHQYKIVELNTDGKAELGGLGNGYGVLQNHPQSGEAGTVAIRGASKVRAGGALTTGNYITVKSGGWAVAVASGDSLPRVLMGQAIETVASGAIGTIEIDKQLVMNVVSGSIVAAPPSA